MEEYVKSEALYHTQTWVHSYYMEQIIKIQKKHKKLAIGLMSGTSVDGIDAVLVNITGFGTNTEVQELAFLSMPYDDKTRNTLLELAKGESGGSKTFCQINFLIGILSAEVCRQLCDKAGVLPQEIDFVGSHGHTFYHIPIPTLYLGKTFASTFQLGEAAVIAEALGCPVVSDFRVRDVAAGGQGAPLVPYTEFLLYNDSSRNVGLQNIGGIANISIIPKSGTLNDVMAFDTGPGNMIIDALVSRYTNNTQRYDNCGDIAAKGKTSAELLRFLLNDNYYTQKPPKTTGREVYNETFIEQLIQKSKTLNLSWTDMICTATAFTAQTITDAIINFANCTVDRLIVGGGGSKNKTLLNFIKKNIPNCDVITNEDIGLNSDSKEAIAFAILANEALHGQKNIAKGATGARHQTVTGKISL